MINEAHADRRIALLEIELAERQTAAAFRQLEAKLVRLRLVETLAVAMNILDRAAGEFERAHDDISQ